MRFSRNVVNARLACTAALVAAMLLAMPSGAAAAQSTPPASPDFSMSQVGVPRGADEKYVTMFDPAARWPATFHWKYNHTNASSQLAGSKAAIVATLQAALDKWSSQCNVKYQYDGETTNVPHATDGVPAPDMDNVVGWGTLDPVYSSWTYDWWAPNGGGRDLVDADVLLNNAEITSLAELERAATHEWGHAIGLNHSNVNAAIMAGPPLTQYNQLVSLQSDDVRGCRCLYGTPPGVSAPYVCQLPSSVDFGQVSMGTPSASKSVPFHNSGTAPLSIDNASVGNAAFRVAGCDGGTVVPPGGTCNLQVTAAPQVVGTVSSSVQLFTNDGMYEVPVSATGTAAPPVLGLPPPAPTVDVVEFYNASLNHYFITFIAAEIANLDAGLTPTRWTRTGLTFKAYPTTQPGTSQVCRYYIPPTDGNSHFFGRDPAECNSAAQAHPEFVLEDPHYMYLFVPTAGVCPSGTTPIYRLYNNKPDANHRYVTDARVRDQMIAQGWIAEGDGADRVVMCAPQ